MLAITRSNQIYHLAVTRKMITGPAEATFSGKNCIRRALLEKFSGKNCIHQEFLQKRKNGGKN